MALLSLAACGDGGGGGGGDGGGSGNAELLVLHSTTFLSREAGAPANADPRTSHKVQFRIGGLENPEHRLTDADLEVRLNGEVDVEAPVTLADDDTEKKDVTLILDVSSSLTTADLANVKASAKDFVAELLPLTNTLRIYEFASRSETRSVGVYEATGNATTGYTWNLPPNPDLDAINSGSNSTALFHAVRTAIEGDPEGDDILVLFSDGQENSSAEGDREEAVRLIGKPGDKEEDKIAVFSVGFGSVDPDEMRQLSVNGKFLGVRPSLVGLFDQVAREIRSIYTLVYDTPAAFGTQTLDVRITAEKRRVGFETSLLAGIDLARAAVVQFPTLPGSSVRLNDLRTTPPTVLAYTVAPLERSVRRDDGLLAFAIEPAPGCTSPACKTWYQGVFGAGAQDEKLGVYVPAVLVENGEKWNDPVTGAKDFQFRGFSDQSFSSLHRKYRCAEVSSSRGTYYFAPEVGLVRAVDTEGNVLVELAAPPCLVDGFSGPCSTE